MVPADRPRAAQVARVGQKDFYKGRYDASTFNPSSRIVDAPAYAEISGAAVRRGTPLGGTMTINDLPSYVMRTVFLSLAAAIAVFVGMLLLTNAHP
jgi:hypothetical protein